MKTEDVLTMSTWPADSYTGEKPEALASERKQGYVIEPSLA